MLLREWREGGHLFDQSAVESAIETLEAFRARFSQTQVLARVRIGAEGMARRRVSTVEATQRTKRTERIVGKLVRLPSMKLSRMEDVVGCRLVVEGLADLRAVVQCLDDQWGDAIVRRHDYVAEPKSTGYRAYHLVVRRDDLPVEVQVRTSNQHFWARTVEAEETRTGMLLKDGIGPESMLRPFRAGALALAEVDSGAIRSEVEFNRRYAAILRER